MNPGEEKQVVEFRSAAASLEFSVRVRCDDNYYGVKCNKVCRPRDDYFGHYVCDQLGNRGCMDGWTGADCKTGATRDASSSKRAVGRRRLVPAQSPSLGRDACRTSHNRPSGHNTGWTVSLRDVCPQLRSHPYGGSRGPEGVSAASSGAPAVPVLCCRGSRGPPPFTKKRTREMRS